DSFSFVGEPPQAAKYGPKEDRAGNACSSDFKQVLGERVHRSPHEMVSLTECNLSEIGARWWEAMCSKHQAEGPMKAPRETLAVCRLATRADLRRRESSGCGRPLARQ